MESKNIALLMEEVKDTASQLERLDKEGQVIAFAFLQGLRAGQEVTRNKNPA
jgi:hypothetical protein